MFTLLGWYESVDPAAAWVDLNAVPDPHATVAGDDIFVPELNKLIMAAVLVDLTAAAQARISSPSLLEDGFQEYLDQVASGLTFGTPPEMHDRSVNPLELMSGEAMKFQVNDNPGAAIGHYGLVWLADGAVAPAGGRIRTIRATGAATLAAGTWVNTALTFPTSLRAGKYAIVGMRVEGANLVAARLVIPGSGHRPGVPAANAQTDNDYKLFRNGNAGIFGEFVHAAPPTLDCLGITDTAQLVYLDVIYMGA
ncbi:hypothetical protein MUP79_09925 [Candidatus Bathyarchaeota archaeon]|nr:hypothetical protein [Candidatus Bathyarchaeota archaeon]